MKDVGAYNLALLEPFELGYKLGVLDLADWIFWGDRYPVFPVKKKARGLLTMVRHGHAEAWQALTRTRRSGPFGPTSLSSLKGRCKRRESYARSSELASSFSVGACNTRV